MTIDQSLEAVVQRDTLLKQGAANRDIRRMMADGVLIPIRRGAYGQSEIHRDLEPWNRHAVIVVATLPKLGSDAIVSHLSAAAVLGLSVWPSHDLPVHISRAAAGGGRKTRTLHLHPAVFGDGQVITVRGTLVTSVARTVVDIARTETFETAVVLADDALHRNLVSREELLDVLSMQRGLTGSGRAARVIEFADGRSESAGESRSRVAILRMGLEVPEPQFNVHDLDGMWLARVDFAYVSLRIAGEFDGRGKYQRHLKDGDSDDPIDGFVAQKRREEALERSDWIVTRWMWDELAKPMLIKQKLLKAFDDRQRMR